MPGLPRTTPEELRAATTKAIDAEEIRCALEDAFARQEADASDRRCLRGKYAPPVGKCRVCGGEVTGKVEFPSDGRIGGPPLAGYVGSWSCDSCFLVYARCPGVQRGTMTTKATTKRQRPRLPKAPDRIYLEQWPEEAQRSDAVHYIQTGYGDDMRGHTSRITVYVKEKRAAKARKK